MNKRIITFCYRKIIDAASAKPWDKLVFEDSFMEFKMQAQNYSTGTPYTSYADLVKHVPNAARLAGLVTPSITGYVQQLGSIMPEILNNAGRRFLQFDRFQLEIINSDINDKAKHQIAINFYSVPMLWHDTIQNLLLVSSYDADGQQKSTDANEFSTNLLQLPPYLNISSLKTLI